jgi:hypothetical protein
LAYLFPLSYRIVVVIVIAIGYRGKWREYLSVLAISVRLIYRDDYYFCEKERRAQLEIS